MWEWSSEARCLPADPCNLYTPRGRVGWLMGYRATRRWRERRHLCWNGWRSHDHVFNTWARRQPWRGDDVPSSILTLIVRVLSSPLTLMQSWLSSWLPGLPSLDFTLPASLQGKFISFVLKKTLGHFLRPGQLDSRQVDSQIGSGFVQINELELDNEVRLSPPRLPAVLITVPRLSTLFFQTFL